MRKRGETSSSAKGAARRDLIIDTATRLVARNGSRGVTLAQIAEESGVSQAGLLYHFPSKDELLHAALDRRDEREGALQWAEDDDPGLGVFDIVARAVEGWSGEPDAVGMHTVLVAENVGQVGPLHERLRDRYGATVGRLAHTIAAAQRDGAIRGDVDPELKAIEIIAFLNGLETAWLLDPSLPVTAVAKAWADDEKRAIAP